MLPDDFFVVLRAVAAASSGACFQAGQTRGDLAHFALEPNLSGPQSAQVLKKQIL